MELSLHGAFGDTEVPESAGDVSGLLRASPRATALLFTLLALLTQACGDPGAVRTPSSPDGDPSPSDDGANSDDSEDSGDASDTGDGDSQTSTLSLSNVRTAGDSHWGVVELSLPYDVAADGLLVVGLSWYEPAQSNTPTFNGADLILAAHAETVTTRLRVTHGALYYLPVTTGQSGTIQITFPIYARRVTMTAVTVAGATTMVDVQTAVTDDDPAPLRVDMAVSFTAPAMAITLFSSSANIDSVVTGIGHVEISNPTQPLQEFHDGRTYSGSANLEAGDHTLGYAQDPAGAPSSMNLYESVMIVAKFR